MPQQSDLTLAQAHGQFYSHPPDIIERAPGRINLIGEHIDYSGGIVLPMPIDRHARVAVSLGSQPGMINAHAIDLNSSVSIQLDQFMATTTSPGDWANYVVGTIASMHDLMPTGWLDTHGIDITLTSSVPRGAGLSSSAALEVAMARALRSLCGILLDPLELAKRCQHAEHTYAGVPCGLMDQAAASIAPHGKLIAFDCDSLHATIIDRPPAMALVVIDSGIRHALGDSAYGERRAAAQEAARLSGAQSLRALRSTCNTNSFSDLPLHNQRAAQHAITEMDRVDRAIECLHRGDLDTLGHLVNESHASLRDVLKVSCPEADQLVEIAQSTNGVLGARIIGGGFGGCVLIVTHEAHALSVSEAILGSCPADIDASLVLIDRPNPDIQC